jgi:hypothetical protein
VRTRTGSIAEAALTDRMETMPSSHSFTALDFCCLDVLQGEHESNRLLATTAGVAIAITTSGGVQ